MLNVPDLFNPPTIYGPKIDRYTRFKASNTLEIFAFTAKNEENL